MADLAVTRKTPLLRPLSEHRTLRISTLFLLYVARGLPLGLINLALPAWLAQNGASAAIGGVLAMARQLEVGSTVSRQIEGRRR